ncbi:MAG: molybdenum cofactor biosynthesis protein MoaE [Beijerinckiaceae bacterium]|jgi:molybdopterin synthase catalytic subunit|nr:molybdenum cofactor biosynthesis protein MoaE [Beijerinckiaceae bacterium]
MIHVAVLDAPFDPEAASAAFRASHAGQTGAVASFLGLVRGAEGEMLELTHYPALTLPMIERQAQVAFARFGLTGLTIIHRVGRMASGEPIVLVLAAAVHRRAAFDAVDCLMDFLKSEAPFWKRAHGPDGSRWIEPTDADRAALSRWAAPTQGDPDS